MTFNTPLRDWHGKTVWLVGASSGIGRATASALHAQGATVFVSARQAQALDDWVAQHPGSDAQGRSRAVALPLDVTDLAQVQAAARSIEARQAIDLVLYCAGHYRAQRADAFDLKEMLVHQRINYLGALYVLDTVLPGLRAQGSGHISLVSSVAGFRGLPQSLAYGPTKAALINLAETLYLDLQPLGIGVSLVNPGFVETPLTAQNEFKMPGLITPEQAAQAMLAGWARGDFDIHYPKRFTRWMKLLRLLPYRLYFPLVRKFTGL
ncbi:MAG: SDR family NAD(P)-dependent oxidoreductase [Burkholderiales bacterium]|nr:SDR family NAD(P)-dependent oxidoreductase [Burkholderiales bacterium]